MKRELFFDLETKNLFKDVNSNNPADLGVSIVSCYYRELDQGSKESSGQLKSFWEPDFKKMWSWFTSADRIIGFNTLGFDIPALQPYTDINLAQLPHFDMLEIIRQSLKKRLSLSVLARETLGYSKTDIGTNAVYYWREKSKKSLKKLQKYCEDDVKLTRDMYDFVVKNKYLKYKDKWNHSQKVELDFSYPIIETPDNEQTALF